MNKKLVIALLSTLAILALGSGSLLGQDENAPAVAGKSIWVRAGADDQDVRVIRSGGSWLGVNISDIGDEQAAELGLSDKRGALVTGVTEGSPAEKAGLKKGDVVVEFDGERVRSSAQLTRLVRETPSGTQVNLTVRRGATTQALTATLDVGRGVTVALAGPANRMIRVAPTIELPALGKFAFFRSRPTLGISGDSLTGQLAEYFKVKQGKGVLISEVTADSAAAKAGLKAGDVIIKVGDSEIESINQLRRALGKADKDNPRLTLTIVRNGAEQQMPVTLDIPEESGVRGWSWRVCGDEDAEGKTCSFDFDFDLDLDLDGELLEDHRLDSEEHWKGSMLHMHKTLKEKEDLLRERVQELRDRLLKVRELSQRTI